MLYEITKPRLLTGDLWTVNVLLVDGAAEPTISGVLDFDRTWWGGPGRGLDHPHGRGQTRY